MLILVGSCKHLCKQLLLLFVSASEVDKISAYIKSQRKGEQTFFAASDPGCNLGQRLQRHQAYCDFLHTAERMR